MNNCQNSDGNKTSSGKVCEKQTEPHRASERETDGYCADGRMNRCAAGRKEGMFHTAVGRELHL